MFRFPGRHSVEKKYDDGKKSIKLKKRTALKKIERKLKKCYFEKIGEDEDKCVICLGNNESIKLKKKTALKKMKKTYKKIKIEK